VCFVWQDGSQAESDPPGTETGAMVVIDSKDKTCGSGFWYGSDRDGLGLDHLSQAVGVSAKGSLSAGQQGGEEGQVCRVQDGIARECRHVSKYRRGPVEGEAGHRDTGSSLDSMASQPNKLIQCLLGGRRSRLIDSPQSSIIRSPIR